MRHDLKRIDKAIVKRVIGKLEHELPIKALTYPMLTGRFSGLRKYRVGDYRVIYTVQDQNVLILQIGHRKEIYRNH